MYLKFKTVEKNTLLHFQNNKLSSKYHNLHISILDFKTNHN